MSKKDKLLLKLLMEKYGVDEDGFKSGTEGSSTGSYGLNPEDGDNVEIYSKGEYKYKSSYELPEEVWTEHGEFLYSLKCRWLPIIPSQLDTQEAETVAWLLNIYRVRKVSYKTSNYNKVNYTVEGGDPFKIAETIYKYICVGVPSVGNLTCTFETTSGETRHESFDYVY